MQPNDPRIIKPPLGVMPEQLHNEQRLNDLVDAMGRYRNAGQSIPAAWFQEAGRLSKLPEVFQSQPRCAIERAIDALEGKLVTQRNYVRSGFLVDIAKRSIEEDEKALTILRGIFPKLSHKPGDSSQ